jgi:hypothetical protein
VRRKPVTPAAKRLLLAQARPALQPYVQEAGLTWDEAVPVFEKLDSRDDVQRAIDDPDTFMASLAVAATPAAKRLLIAKARPMLQPYVQEAGSTWDEVVPVLEQLDSREEVQKAIDDPEMFMASLAVNNVRLVCAGTSAAQPAAP